MNIIKTDGRDNIQELQLNILIFQEENFYMAFCPSLNLSSYGESIQDAKEGFDEVLDAFIADTKALNSLEKDLKALGWTLQPGNAIPPEQIELNIPAGLLKKQYNERIALC